MDAPIPKGLASEATACAWVTTVLAGLLYKTPTAPSATKINPKMNSGLICEKDLFNQDVTSVFTTGAEPKTIGIT